MRTVPLTPVSRTERARRMSEDALAAVERSRVARGLATSALLDARTTQDRCVRQVREHVLQSRGVLERTAGRRVLARLAPAGH